MKRIRLGILERPGNIFLAAALALFPATALAAPPASAAASSSFRTSNEVEKQEQDRCLPDAPHAGLLSAMRKRAGQLPAGDELRAELEAAAALIDSYTSERQALCRDLDAGAVALAAARQQRDGWRQNYEDEVQTSALYRERWQQALKAPATSSKQRLIACGPGGGLVYEADGTVAARPLAACIIPIFPR